MSLLPTPDEFYIGYLPKAPGKTARVIVSTVVTLIIVVFSVCVLLVTNQRKFSKGVFEFGQLSAVEGVLSLDPIPNIRILEEGKSKMIMLVGFGKMGALPTITELEKRGGKTLNNQFVSLRGTRIYDHGKELLQITFEDNYNIAAKPLPENFPAISEKTLGKNSFVGEIVDPKCYFGVMKPGEGKPHRSCAIRCIAGGIPPVFAIGNVDDDFVILTGEKINEEIIPLVGDAVQLEGEVIEVADWKIMKVNMDNLKLQAKSKTKKNLLALEEDMTICSNPM